MDGEHDAHSHFNLELTRHYDALKRELTHQVRKMYRSWNRPLDPWTVEDEVADLFVGIHKAKNNYDPSRAFKPWANEVALYRLKDRERQFGRESERHRTRYESYYQSEDVFDLLIEHCAADRDAEARRADRHPSAAARQPARKGADGDPPSILRRRRLRVDCPRPRDRRGHRLQDRLQRP